MFQLFHAHKNSVDKYIILVTPQEGCQLFYCSLPVAGAQQIHELPYPIQYYLQKFPHKPHKRNNI